MTDEKSFFTAEDFEKIVIEAVYTDHAKWGAMRISEIANSKVVPLVEENARLREGLKASAEVIHDEFCGYDHHTFCVYAHAALESK